jgi:hypothetical protein
MLGFAFLAANLSAFILLLRQRYYRLFPWFSAALAAICWQAFVAAVLPATSRLNRYLWAPGEALAILLLAAAILDATWRSIHQRCMPLWRQVLMMAGLVVGAAGLAFDTSELTPGQDWYWRFVEIRLWVFLGLALMAFVGFWVGLYDNPRWPRVARMHTGLLATLAASHTLFGGMLHWQSNAINYRLLGIACCGGWLINSRLLAGERIEEAQRFPYGFPPQLWPAHLGELPSHRTSVQGD